VIRHLPTTFLLSFLFVAPVAPLRAQSGVAPGRQIPAGSPFGGGVPQGMPPESAYLEPTIFDGVDPAMKIAQEEIFGPVVAVIPFAGEREAIELANATPYGLAAAVWSRDIFRAFRVVRRLRAGIVWVNHMQPTFVEAPWGGMKMSGSGRELGLHGVDNYLEQKQVHINLNENPVGWY